MLGFGQESECDSYVDVITDDDILVNTSLPRLCIRCLNPDGTLSLSMRFELGSQRFTNNQPEVNGVRVINSVLVIDNPGNLIPQGEPGQFFNCAFGITAIFSTIFSSGKYIKGPLKAYT